MRTFIFIFFLGLHLHLFSQNTFCDTVYEVNDFVDEARYKNNGTDILQYFREEILPILSEEHLEEPPTSFRMKLIISAEGKVLGKTDLRGNYSQTTKDKLNQKVKTMSGWLPATRDGKTVCSEAYFVITCIIWE